MQKIDDLKLGKELFSFVRSRSNNIFSRDWLKNQALKIATLNPKIQLQLFRFVDILPSLKSEEDVTKYLAEYLAEANQGLSLASSLVAKLPLVKNIYRFGIRQSVNLMAASFICGSNVKEAKKTIKRLEDKGQDYTLDILGELTVSDSEANHYFSEYRSLIANIIKPNLSIKLSALAPQINNMDFENKKDRIKSRLRIIFREAQAKEGFINIDTEHYYWKDFCFELLRETLMEAEFKAWAGVGVVVQAYLKSSRKDLLDWISWAKKRGAPIMVRLVKGAYWDYETAHAHQYGKEAPVFEYKPDTDVNYENLALVLLDNHKSIRPAFASHNIRSLSVILAYAEKHKIGKNCFELQMLYGMMDDLKDYFSERGYTIRVYLPYGELIPGMAYLVRRLLENTANDSFLKQGFLDSKQAEDLLVDPREYTNTRQSAKEGFANSPYLDLFVTENRTKILKKISELKEYYSTERRIPALIAGEEVFNDNSFESVNPAQPSEILAKVTMSSTTDCDKAAHEAQEAFSSWSKLDVETRAECLEYAAIKLKLRKLEFIALLCLEAGKPWAEADGEIAEAIDFLNYYASEARRLFSENKLRSLTGESNKNVYLPYGVSLIISPWNFPIAILCGMLSASLVSGNSILVKPSSQTAIIAYELIRLMQEACNEILKTKIPGLINFLPGEGKVIGDHLVSHPLVKAIAFTGSNATGMRINELASKARPVKKLTAEMGGKNAIIVDDTADLDEALPGVIYSAFGFSGQKCSACSRLIVLEPVYDEFISRLKHAMQEVLIEAPELGQCYMGPQIDKAAQESINKYIEQGKRDGKLLFGRAKLPDGGYYVSPSIFVNIAEDSKLSQEEIFGPVLVVFKANDLTDALRIANNSSFGLTGGFYSRSPVNIKTVKQEFQTGNLYINRPCTGAVVSRQAFGGLKESSIGYKAGGPNYLLNFVQEKTITENTMRRGFAGD